MKPMSLLKKPVLSEKSVNFREESGVYSFIVNRDANKYEIKKAVELTFDVKVASINTLITKGKWKRRGAHIGATSNKKKAMVKLQEGQKIKLFEEQ